MSVAFAMFDRLPSEVLAVDLDQIKHTQHGGMIAKPVSENIEHRETALVDHNGLAVEHA